jgi:hypothetical protein
MQGVNMPARVEQLRRRITGNIDDYHVMTWIYSSSRAVGKNVAGIERLRKKERRHVKEEIEQDAAGFVATTPAYLRKEAFDINSGVSNAVNLLSANEIAKKMPFARDTARETQILEHCLKRFKCET